MARRRSNCGPAAGPRGSLIPLALHRQDVRILECPECHGVDLYYEAGLITGYKYHCKNCNYIGAFVIEREVEAPRGGPDE